jgi:hypothetical protein
VSRAMPDRPDEDDDLMTRLVAEAGDPAVEPRPEHVAALRAMLLDRLGPPPTATPWPMRRIVGSGIAAACLLAVLAWSRRDDQRPNPNRSTHEVATRPPGGPSREAAGGEGRRGLDGVEALTFHWPLPETASLLVSSPIPPELLD